MGTMLHTALLVSIHTAASPVDMGGWVAEPFVPASGLSRADIRGTYLGVLDDNADLHLPATEPRHDHTNPPPSFDWRNTSSKDCVGGIVDQGKCGSCWAVATVEAFSDRRCLALRANRTSNAARIEMSSLDLIACDKLCTGIENCCRGCTGGYPALAWKFIASKGVVSAVCMPYNLTKSLLCPLPACEPPTDHTTFKAKDVKMVYGGAPSIRAELVRSGPVVATFTVYEDFMNYKRGVYRYVTGKRLGLHAVKVVGYDILRNGTAPAIPYWIVQNSWGEGWGDHGTFKIAVGQCGFEESIQVGVPCLPGEICV